MNGARGIAAAGVLALVVTSAHAAYRSWPVTHGTEIVVPAAIYAQPADVAMVAVALPFARIELDVPHKTPAVTETPVGLAGACADAEGLAEDWLDGVVLSPATLEAVTRK